MLARTSFAIALLVGCHHLSPAPRPSHAPAAPPSTSNAELVKRGEYVVTIAGCVVCHSPWVDGKPDLARKFAGGGAAKVVGGGTWRAPNITMDRETGIGRWTDAQIIGAIREGVRPDGIRLLPVMPYPSYHHMTDADAVAVVAYLRAQPPLHHQIARTWLVHMKPVELPPATGNVDPVGDPVKHGEYLASLMHCAACHTPQQGPQAHVPFAGGNAFALPDGRTIHSQNITSDPGTGIGRWSEEQIVDTIRTMKKPDGEPIEGPMAMYGDSWSRLTEDDARALAAYIHAIPPVHNEIGREPMTSRR